MSKSKEIVDLEQAAKLMKENSSRLKSVLDKWLVVLKEGNKEYARQELARRQY